MAVDRDNLFEKRKSNYSKQAVLPEEVLKDMPYKLTFDALEQGDDDALGRLLIDSTVISMLKTGNTTINSQNKKEIK